MARGDDRQVDDKVLEALGREGGGGGEGVIACWEVKDKRGNCKKMRTRQTVDLGDEPRL